MDDLRRVCSTLYDLRVRHELEKRGDSIPVFNEPESTFYYIHLHGMSMCFDEEKNFLGTLNDETGEFDTKE